MTEDEMRAFALLGEAWNAMLACGVANHETAAHIHVLQHAVMAQTARRMHPELFRQPSYVSAPGAAAQISEIGILATMTLADLAREGAPLP